MKPCHYSFQFRLIINRERKFLISFLIFYSYIIKLDKDGVMSNGMRDWTNMIIQRLHCVLHSI
jgi:hypothetical protein